MTDCSIQTAMGSCPLVSNGATFRLSRCWLSPTIGACGTGQPGPALLGVSQTQPFQSGGPLTLELRNDPFQLIAVKASPGLGTHLLPQFLEQPAFLDYPNYFLAGVFLTDATGVATATWNMPSGLYIETTVWLEAWALTPDLPWQVAPVVGGVIR